MALILDHGKCFRVFGLISYFYWTFRYCRQSDDPLTYDPSLIPAFIVMQLQISLEFRLAAGRLTNCCPVAGFGGVEDGVV